MAQPRRLEWQDELDSHLAMRAEWNRAEGLPADEKGSAIGPAAIRKPPAHAGGKSAPSTRANGLGDPLQDVRLALRSFRNRPPWPWSL